jgi:hypothetical protein
LKFFKKKIELYYDEQEDSWLVVECKYILGINIIGTVLKECKTKEEAEEWLKQIDILKKQ